MWDIETEGLVAISRPGLAAVIKHGLQHRLVLFDSVLNLGWHWVYLSYGLPSFRKLSFYSFLGISQNVGRGTRCCLKTFCDLVSV